LEQLVQIVDAAMAEANARAGAHLACYPGCAVCCFGPFPVTQVDAERLHRGLLQLESSESKTAREIRERAAEAIHRMSRDFPGNPASGTLRLAPEEEGAFAAQYSDLACPALSPQSGMCLLYEHRPIACRTYGPPLLLNDEKLPPCPLCFKRASSEDVEDARVSLEIGDESDQADVPRTLIAFALR
jgi:Fe-S-cluster containining protein